MDDKILAREMQFYSFTLAPYNPVVVFIRYDIITKANDVSGERVQLSVEFEKESFTDEVRMAKASAILRAEMRKRGIKPSDLDIPSLLKKESARIIRI